jgi:hypothetical protein
LITFASIGFISGKCPDPEILNPCKCDKYGISCGGNDVLNLKQIFKAIDEKLNANEKHFEKFILNNEAITELEENTFYGITFDKIEISNATKLKLINSKAFTATNSVTKAFSVNIDSLTTYYSTPLTNSPPTHDIFLMLSSIINLETVNLLSTNITKIPSNAFQSINGSLNNLKTIDFSHSPILEIGDNPFSTLKNLKVLTFYFTNISSIPKTAFHFENDSNESFYLDLRQNNLNGTSFAVGSLDHLKRPTDIYLGYNQNLTFLDQHIFQPFLESNDKNKIFYFQNGSFDCDDCRTYWLKKEPKYNDRFKMFSMCTNGKEYTDKSNFAKCTQ